MCLYAYMCVYVCMYVCIKYFKCINVFMYTRLCIYIYKVAYHVHGIPVTCPRSWPAPRPSGWAAHSSRTLGVRSNLASPAEGGHYIIQSVHYTLYNRTTTSTLYNRIRTFTLHIIISTSSLHSIVSTST